MNGNTKVRGLAVRRARHLSCNPEPQLPLTKVSFAPAPFIIAGSKGLNAKDPSDKGIGGAVVSD
jgi:hypothetical protein